MDVFLPLSLLSFVSSCSKCSSRRFCMLAMSASRPIFLFASLIDEASSSNFPLISVASLFSFTVLRILKVSSACLYYFSS